MHLGCFRPYSFPDYGSSDARAAAQAARTEVEILRGEIERLLILSEALWMLLKEKNGYQDDVLTAKMAEIDLRDGKLDGRVATKEGPVECPNCHRALARRRPSCLYCGRAVLREPFAR